MSRTSSILFALAIFSAQLSTAQDAYFFYNQAGGQMAYENYEGAIALYSKAIDAKSDYVNALANRGVCYHRLKQYDKAIADYQKSELLTKGISSYNMACAYSLLKKPDDAFQWLTLCQKSNYKQSKATLEADTDFENIRADKRWKGILETDWYSPYEKTMQDVMVKWNAGDKPGAITQLTTGIRLEPKKIETYRDRGFVYAGQQEWAKATADYDMMIQLDAKNWEAYSNRADLMSMQKKYAEAILLFQKAMELNPEYKPYTKLAMAHFALDQKKEAAQDLKNHLEFYPKDDFNVYFCGLINYHLSNDNEALRYSTQAIELNPGPAEYYLLKANVLYSRKELNQAIETYNKVLSLNDKLAEGYYMRALAKAERFAKSGDKQDKKDFCADMEKAEAFNYQGAAQYLRELCNWCYAIGRLLFSAVSAQP